MPVEDNHPELYGSGYVNGTIIGMPKPYSWATGQEQRVILCVGIGSRNEPTKAESIDEGVKVRLAVG